MLDSLVKQIAALKQKAAEASKPVAPQPTWSGFDTPATHGGTDTPAQPSNKPVDTLAKPQNRHFEMMTTLDSTRVVKNIGNLMDEVINHLMQVEGANVEIKLFVEATMPDGTPVTTVRTVTENCKTLKVDNFGFDD